MPPLTPPVATEDDQADHLQKLIRERFEIMTNFADLDRQSQELTKVFRTYDLDGSGFLDFAEFEKVLVEIKVNHGRQSAKRALFDRYDNDLDGQVNLRELRDGVFNLKPHPLAKKENRKMLEHIRSQLAKHGGANGIRSLQRIFRILDTSGDGDLSQEEFLIGLKEMGITIDKSEAHIVVDLFDRNKDGNVNFHEFLSTVRGKLNPRRMALVQQAWLRLDKHNDGEVTLEELLDIYDVSQRKEVVDGKMTEMQAIKDVAKLWDHDGNGTIVFEEFVEYYKDLSASVDSDRKFELMMRNTWHITGGSKENAADNTANMQVVVTFEDQRTEVITLQDDLGVAKDDWPMIRKKLFLQGVRDVLHVEPKLQGDNREMSYRTS
jgi:Ca2+-binding EF-hand superfamily protein|tara:strand:+ start:11044 stop:12177 length:1134 start_codon:yes stop_codon:yes gene_type:complete